MTRSFVKRDHIRGRCQTTPPPAPPAPFHIGAPHNNLLSATLITVRIEISTMSDADDATPLPPMLAEDAGATLYKYRDFASVAEDLESEPAASSQANRSLESSIRVQKFPVKLYAILAQKEFSDIITWMPHGRSWKVLKPNLFESLVMPLFFEYSNYHSFNRLVNAWSFRRISSGPDRGSYYHEVCDKCFTDM